MVLEREGYTQIEPVDDELTARLRAERDQPPQTAADFRFEAKLWQRPGQSSIWMEAVRRHRWILLLDAALLAWGALHGFSLAFWIGLAGLALFVVPMLGSMKPAVLYDGLQKAYALGDADEAERLLERMQALPSTASNAQLRVDLLFRKASLLARRGQLDEALALVGPLRGDPQLRDGLFESRTASIYYAAGRIPDFVEWQRRSLEASGQSAMQALDYAFVLARYGDVAQARRLLGGLDPANMNAIHKAVRLASEGVCALRERDYPAASRLLAAAVKEFKPFAASAPTWPFQGIVAGYAALAAARNGDHDEAKNLLAPWRPVAFNCLDASTRTLLEAEVGS
jgi:tetratricopeptide (TPR) repeat protein